MLPDIGLTAHAQINCAALAQGISSPRLILHALQHVGSCLSQSEMQSRNMGALQRTCKLCIIQATADGDGHMGDYKIGGCLCTPAVLTEWVLIDWLRNGDDEMKPFLKPPSTRA